MSVYFPDTCIHICNIKTLGAAQTFQSLIAPSAPRAYLSPGLQGSWGWGWAAGLLGLGWLGWLGWAGQPWAPGLLGLGHTSALGSRALGAGAGLQGSWGWAPGLLGLGHTSALGSWGSWGWAIGAGLGSPGLLRQGTK